MEKKINAKKKENRGKLKKKEKKGGKLEK